MKHSQNCPLQASPSDSPLILNVMEDYLRHQLDMGIIVQASANAARSDMRGLVRYLEHQGLPQTLEAYSTRNIGAYLASYRPRRRGSTIDRWYKSFRGFGRWATDRNLLAKNPVESIRLGWIPKCRREFLFAAGDARRFLEVSCDTGLLPEVDRAMRSLGLFSGLRRNEYLKLQWRHIDFAEAEIWIYDTRGSRRKGHANLFDRIIPMARPLRDALESLRTVIPNKPDDPVLVTRRLQVMTKDAFYGAFAAIFGAMGLDSAVPHSLRHNLGGSLLAVGATHEDVALVLGHSTSSPDGRPTTTDPYNTSSLAGVRHFLERYAEQVLADSLTPGPEDTRQPTRTV